MPPTSHLRCLSLYELLFCPQPKSLVVLGGYHFLCEGMGWPHQHSNSCEGMVLSCGGALPVFPPDGCDPLCKHLRSACHIAQTERRRVRRENVHEYLGTVRTECGLVSGGRCELLILVTTCSSLKSHGS